MRHHIIALTCVLLGLVAIALPASAAQVGEAAPPVALTGDDGMPYDLAAMHGEKAVVLVFFRGPW